MKSWSQPRKRKFNDLEEYDKNVLGNVSTDSTLQNEKDWKSIQHGKSMGIMASHAQALISNHRYSKKLCSLGNPDSQAFGPPSLRYIATDTILSYFDKNPDEITLQVMGKPGNPYMPWDTLWSSVWDILATKGRDSYEMFKLFATVFSADPHFRCHDSIFYMTHFGTKLEEFKPLPDLDSSGNLFGGERHKMMLKRIACGDLRHRFERVSSTIDFAAFRYDISTLPFQNIVLLDLSGTALDRMSYVCLTSIPTLAGLDLRDCTTINSGVVTAWTEAVKRGRWKCLRVLSLSVNVKVLEDSLNHLLNNLPMLAYLEVTGKWTVNLTGNDWANLDQFRKLFKSKELVSSSLINASLGVKFKSLRQLYIKLTNRSSDFFNPFLNILPNLPNSPSYIIQEFEFLKDAETLRVNDSSNLWKENSCRYLNNLTTSTSEYFRIPKKGLLKDSFRVTQQSSTDITHKSKSSTPRPKKIGLKKMPVNLKSFLNPHSSFKLNKK